LGDTINVINNSTVSDGAINYDWNFGNGETSNESNPSFIYSNSGQYNVLLTATSKATNCIDTTSLDLFISPKFNKEVTIDTFGVVEYKGSFYTSSDTIIENLSTVNGCDSLFTTYLYIYPYDTMVVNFGSDTNKSCLSDSIQFLDLTLGDPHTWLWDFGDGNTSNLKNPKHKYSSPGNYTVKLTATNNLITKSFEINNYITILSLPIVDLGLDTNSICEYSSLTLSATNVNSTYLWNDNSTDSILVVNSPGNYFVTVTDDNNCSQNDTVYIDLLDVDVSLSKTTFCEGEIILISSAVSSEIDTLSYLWSNNDTTPNSHVVPGDDSEFIVYVNNTLTTCSDTINSQHYNFLPSFFELDYYNVCDSLTWKNGVNYSATNFTSSQTYVHPSGCDSTYQLNLVVTPSTTDFIFSDSVVCFNGNNISPTITGLSGGYFTANNGLEIDSLTGEIDVSESTVGDYTVSYSFVEAGNFRQLGSTIDGENSGDNFGQSVAISANGLVFAASANKNGDSFSAAGKIRVYSWQDSIWSQLGNDILGENSGDEFGYSISMNADGTRLVASSILNDDAFNNAGLVKVFEWNGANWVQMGSNIYGDNAGDELGYKVEMSEDGNRIAVSSINYQNRRGLVKVIEWNGSNWIIVGNIITGEHNNERNGSSISFNTIGSRLIVGSPYYKFNNILYGRARVFNYDGNNWMQIGSDIIGNNSNDYLGSVVSISGNGETIIVSSPFSDENLINSGKISTLNWDGNDWSYFGGNIYGESFSEYYGKSLSSNFLGDRIIIGGFQSDVVKKPILIVSILELLKFIQMLLPIAQNPSI
jgi:PKD repeat protein